jgi:hypothetical protein
MRASTLPQICSTGQLTFQFPDEPPVNAERCPFCKTVNPPFRLCCKRCLKPMTDERHEV